MKKITTLIIAIALMAAMTTSLYANETTVTDTFYHALTPLTFSETFDHVMSMPHHLRSQGYYFYDYRIDTSGKARIEYEDLRHYEFRFAMRIRKSFLDFASGEARVVLYARRNAPVPTPPVHPHPSLQTVYPVNATVPATNFTFTWDGGRAPFSIRVMDRLGNEVFTQHHIHRNHFTYNGWDLRVGQQYVWMVRDNWSAYTPGAGFRVVQDHYPAPPPQPAPSPSLIGRTPSEGSSVLRRNVHFTWNGGTAPFSLRVVNQFGQQVITQSSIHQNSFTYNGPNLEEGRRYSWTVTDRRGASSRPINFRATSNTFRNSSSIKADIAATLEGMAETVYGSGDINRAAGMMAALENDEDRQQAQMIIATGLEDEGEWIRALATYLDILDEDEERELQNTPSILIRMAGCYMELENREKAEEVLTIIVDEYANAPEVLEANSMLRALR